VVQRESQPLRVVIDGAPHAAPVSYLARPGPHAVELIRGAPPNESHSAQALQVVAGRRYVVNRPAPAAPSPPSEPAAPEASYDALYADARDHYMRESYDRARSLAAQAVKLARDSARRQDAYRIVVAASCCLNDAERVAEVWHRLDDKSHTWAAYVCHQHGTATPAR
jgi:hypothetical protein